MTEILKKQTSNIVFAQEEENLLDWNEVLKKFQTTFGNDVYESWIRNISLKKASKESNSQLMNRKKY